MTAPCITRLDQAIKNSGSEIEKARLLAEKACYLVRIGEYASAETIRLELRATFGDGRDLTTSVLIMLIEALQSYFEVLGGSAKDRLLRAQLLSKASKNKELIALTSAWLGHLQFHEGDLSAMADSISMSIENIEPDQWAALSRLSSVLGDAFLTLSNSNSAKIWYSHARFAAVSYGDQASVGAITYNQSALRLFDVRLKAALGLPFDAGALELASAEARSAVNYQAVAGVTSLEHLLTSVAAGIDMVNRRYADAWRLLFPLLSKGDVPAGYGFRFVLLSDAVLCCLHLGMRNEAKEYLRQIVSTDLDRLPIDDQIIVRANINSAHSLAPEIYENGYRSADISMLGERLFLQRSAWEEKLARFTEIPEALKWWKNAS